MIRFVGLEINFVWLVGVILLFPSFLPLALGRSELERIYRIETEAARGLKIEEVNARNQKLLLSIAAVSKATEESGRASSLVVGILAKQSSGVQLNNVSIRKNGDVMLSGIALTRQGLLDFEGVLRDAGIFQDISSPLSNIIREQDINFTMQGKLKPQYAL